MALTRPTLNSTAAFDATKQHTFTFNVIGGTQVVANQLVIRNNITNEIVYTEKQETYKYEHIVNAGELTNGIYYNAVLITFDAQGNESQASIPIQFYCYTAPTIQFTNIPASGIIQNASFSFEFLYTQAENERLNSYVVNLYNSAKILLSTSSNVYVLNGTPPYTGSYLFSGFENNTVYFIELNGVTINGTVVSTGLLQISVNYTQPDLFSLIELSNNCNGGYITLKSNIILIEGSSNPTPPVFIDNKEVDLTGSESWVDYSSGYNVSNNFLARAWVRKPTPYSTLIKFSNADGQTIDIRFMKGYEYATDETMKAYVEVIVSSLLGRNYYIYSNYVPILADDKYYTIWLTRVNNIYQIQLLTD